MQSLLGLSINGIDAFILVFVRMTGLFVVAPIFSRRNIPSYMKIAFAFFLALILVNTVTLEKPFYSDNIYQYAVLVTKEFLVGLVVFLSSCYCRKRRGTRKHNCLL